MKKHGRLIILFVGLIILLAASFISCRPVPSSTPPTELPNSPETRLPEGKTQTLVLEDDFSDPESSWVTIPEADKGGNYENEEYVIWVNNAGSKVATLLTLDELSDFVFEIDVKKVSGEKGSYFFILYRLDENNNMYAVGVSDELEYSIVKYILGRATDLLKDWTRSSHIKAGDKSNRLKVVCIGTQTDVYVNGYKLASVTDDTSLKGQIGLGIKSFSESGARYSFDNFKLYTIE
ncbi:MAG: hypothetical protein FJ006_04305 [Chloroflexi bacterium]|nr:hypothetical protein [Chloroflexota bacterium]